ncbi:di/tricarboxylate transporter [Virgibacillus halotolerans]|uniref:SLC13 family permease n=1 Tax=Virgibacillus halotolerans TaxID=1071053 RepID=UPI00195F90D3|nr:SLC13 family permease [Virgibacillus halotolerans]MBM7599140.1 di/tricarboxylate transporter [Virgibacillus halotolerans]
MGLEAVTIILLLLMFVVSTFLSVNIGILAFVTAFVLMSFTGTVTIDDIYASFPADLFILLFGVTYLFAVIQKNGTLDLITGWGLGMVKGNIGLIPWVIFFLGMVLTSIGTSAIAVASILAGIGFRIAYKQKINPLLIAIMIQAGCMAGSFSPLNIFGIIIKGVMNSEGLPFSEVALYMNTFAFYTFLALIAFVSLGGIRLYKESIPQPLGIINQPVYEESKNQPKPKVNIYNTLSIIGIVLLIIFVIGFDGDIGFAALSLGLLLACLTPKIQGEIFKIMPWSAIIMVSGIVTFIGIMEQVGAMILMQNLIGMIGNPVIASLIASYVGGIISAFASTTGFLAAIIPLGVPILSDPSISTMGVVSAISISASIVDLSPFSTVGALFLSNVQGMGERKFFIQLLATAGIFVLIGPFISWLIFVVIGGAF